MSRACIKYLNICGICGIFQAVHPVRDPLLNIYALNIKTGKMASHARIIKNI